MIGFVARHKAHIQRDPDVFRPGLPAGYMQALECQACQWADLNACYAELAALRARLAESEAREQVLREATEDALSYLERVREPFGLMYESECDPLIEQLGQALAAAHPATAEPARPDAGGEGQ